MPPISFNTPYYIIVYQALCKDFECKKEGGEHLLGGERENCGVHSVQERPFRQDGQDR